MKGRTMEMSPMQSASGAGGTSPRRLTLPASTAQRSQQKEPAPPCCCACCCCCGCCREGSEQSDGVRDELGVEPLGPGPSGMRCCGTEERGDCAALKDGLLAPGVAGWLKGWKFWMECAISARLGTSLRRRLWDSELCGVACGVVSKGGGGARSATSPRWLRCAVPAMAWESGGRPCAFARAMSAACSTMAARSCAWWWRCCCSSCCCCCCSCCCCCCCWPTCPCPCALRCACRSAGGSICWPESCMLRSARFCCARRWPSGSSSARSCSDQPSV
mmetsp:Transcript_26443/g.77705  ORF Transcript_26443/g.77705 Transcript_26443/m.77705 type:complete len:275 (+) Transcript_26443:1862-2686(+)